MVLEALSQQPFESLGDISLKLLSFKTSLLLVLASAKHDSDLHALCMLSIPHALNSLSVEIKFFSIITKLYAKRLTRVHF